MSQQQENKMRAALNSGSYPPRILEPQLSETQMKMDFDTSENTNHNLAQNKIQPISTSNLISKELKKYSKLQECLEKLTRIQIKPSDESNGTRSSGAAVDLLSDIIGQLHDKAGNESSSGQPKIKSPQYEEIKSESQHAGRSARYQQYTDEPNNNNEYKQLGNLFSTSSQIEHISQMSQKQPSSPAQSHFDHSEPNRLGFDSLAESEAFKENLKLILGTLVDQVWKQKQNQPSEAYQKFQQNHKTPTQREQYNNKLMRISRAANRRYKNSFESVEHIDDFANEQINKINQEQCCNQPMTISFKEQQYQDQDPLDVNTSLTESQKIRSKSMQKRCPSEYQQLQEQNLLRQTKKIPNYTELRESSELISTDKLVVRTENPVQPNSATGLRNIESYNAQLPFVQGQNAGSKPEPGSAQDYSFYNTNNNKNKQEQNSMDSILSSTLQNESIAPELQLSASPRTKGNAGNSAAPQLQLESKKLTQPVRRGEEGAAAGAEYYDREAPERTPERSSPSPLNIASAQDGIEELGPGSPAAARRHSDHDVTDMAATKASPSCDQRESLSAAEPEEIHTTTSVDREEQEARTAQELHRQQVLQNYQRLNQGCLDDSSSSSSEHDEYAADEPNGEFKFAEKLNNFSKQINNDDGAPREYLDHEDSEDEEQRAMIDLKLKLQQQHQEAQAETGDKEESQEEEEEYQQTQPNFMQQIKMENNKNTYRWDVVQNSNSTKEKFDNLFSELTVDESDYDSNVLDKQREIAATALGRNDPADKHQKAPELEQIEQNNDQVEAIHEEDRPVQSDLQQRMKLQEQIQAAQQQMYDDNQQEQQQRPELQQQQPGYIINPIYQKQFESVLEDVEAENKEYSDEMESPVNMSFDKRPRPDHLQIESFSHHDNDRVEVQSAKSCVNVHNYDLLTSKIEEKMRQLLHHESVENLGGQKTASEQSIQVNNSIASGLEKVKMLSGSNDSPDVPVRRPPMDNNPVILLESEDGAEEKSFSDIHIASPSKASYISGDNSLTKQEKIQKIIMLKNQYKASIHSNLKGSIHSKSSKNSKERSANSIKLSVAQIGESILSNRSNGVLSTGSLPRSKEDRLSAQKFKSSPRQSLEFIKATRIPAPEQLQAKRPSQISSKNGGNSADKAKAVPESPAIASGNPRTSVLQSELFTSGISRFSEVSFIKDSVIRSKESILKSNNQNGCEKSPPSNNKEQSFKNIQPPTKEPRLLIPTVLKEPTALAVESSTSNVKKPAERSSPNLSFDSKCSKSSKMSKRSSKPSKTTRDALQPSNKLAHSSSTKSLRSQDSTGSKTARKAQYQGSMVSNYTTGSNLEASPPETHLKAASKSGLLSAFTSSLSRRLSYQPSSSKLRKVKKDGLNVSHLQQDENTMPPNYK